MRWRLDGGIPQLTFDQLSICPQHFASLVARIADVCLHHGHPALRIPDKTWTPDELAKLAQQAFETWDMPTKPSKDGSDTKQPSLGSLTALTVGYALAAHLRRASETISPDLDLSLWTYGYCPICGGRPSLALQQGERQAYQLVCSRCTCVWPYPTQACPFCETGDTQEHCAGDYGPYRVRACHHCIDYLVAVDLQKIERQVHPQVERLLTVGLDLAVRPSIPTQ